MKRARVIGLLALLLNCCPALRAQDVKAWTIDELAKRIRARDQVLKTLSLDAQFQIRGQSESTLKFYEYATAVHIEMDWATGRYLMHRYGQAEQPPAPMLGKKDIWFLARDEFMAFDGEKTRRFTKGPGVTPGTGEENAVMTRATVDAGSRFAWTIDPKVFVGVYGGRSLADRLTDVNRDYQIIPANEPNVVLVQGEGAFDPVQSDGARSRDRHWIDTSKNMALAQVEWCIRETDWSGWVPYLKTKTAEWVEIDGFWLPRRFREEFYQVQGGNIRLVRDTVATISDWSVNQEIPAERFKIQFEPGTVVNDHDRGTTYRAGRITDRTVAADARAAEALREQYGKARDSLGAQVWPDEGQGRDPRRIIVGTVIGLVILAAGTAAWARHHRKRMERSRTEATS
jgi:hypothetical protein